MYTYKEIRTIFKNCNTIDEIYHARFVFKIVISDGNIPDIKIFFIRKMNRERLMEITKSK